MKNSIKAGIFFGLFMTFWFVFADIFIEKQDISSALVAGITKGFLAATLFGFTLHFFVRKIGKIIQIDLQPGEELIFQTNANHFKGIEAVGGKLSLTNKRLVFKSHKLNIQSHIYTLPSEQIKAVERYKTMGIVNNGLKIITLTSIEKFVVEKPEEWQSKLYQYNIAAPGTL